MKLENYEHSRSGQYVVALHSSASNSKQWRQLTIDMANQHEVLACELPDYPDSDYQRCFSNNGMSAVADPILKDIQKLGQPVHLVGHSFGGAVALKIALTQPNLIKSLTLYEPASFHIMNDDDDEDRNLFSDLKRIADTLSAETLAGRPDLGMKGFVDFWNGEGAWENLSRAAQCNLAKSAKLVASDFSCLFHETWKMKSLGCINIPTMMLVGMNSPAIAQQTAIRIAGHIDNARIEMLPNLGHMAPVFNPQCINPLIHQHIIQVEKTVHPDFLYQANAA